MPLDHEPLGALWRRGGARPEALQRLAGSLRAGYPFVPQGASFLHRCGGSSDPSACHLLTSPTPAFCAGDDCMPPPSIAFAAGENKTPSPATPLPRALSTQRAGRRKNVVIMLKPPVQIIPRAPAPAPWARADVPPAGPWPAVQCTVALRLPTLEASLRTGLSAVRRVQPSARQRSGAHPQWHRRRRHG